MRKKTTKIWCEKIEIVIIRKPPFVFRSPPVSESTKVHTIDALMTQSSDKVETLRLERIKVRLVDDLSYMALRDIVQNERDESQGKLLIGTSNLAKFRGK